MTTTVGEAATTEIKNITFNDEDAVTPLLELKQNYPDSDVFVSGNLTVDFPEDIQISLKKNNHATGSLNGTTLKKAFSR